MSYSSNYNEPAPPPPPAGHYVAIPLNKPFITYITLGVIVLVWVAMTMAGGSEELEVLIQFGANSGWHILVRGEYWRLFTSMFLHIGLLHLAFNSYALFLFGVEMERIYGPTRFTVLYILAGLFGSFASYASKGPLTLSAGASGAIFGVIGMNLAYFLLHRQAFGKFGRQRINTVVIIIIINLIFGFTVPGIDNIAHIGGLVVGFLLGYALAPHYKMADELTGQAHLIDTNSMLKRWWVPVLAVAILILGLQMAEYFWLNQLGRI